MKIEQLAVQAAEGGWLPDFVVRAGIRALLRRGLDRYQTDYPPEQWLPQLRQGPIALVPERANQHHYELPPRFFTHVLGPRLKYSSCFWPTGTTDLGAAERAMLALTCAMFCAILFEDGTT